MSRNKYDKLLERQDWHRERAIREKDMTGRTTRRNLIAGTAASLIAAFAAGGALAAKRPAMGAAGRQPNIIIIYADDIG
jgi:hypothetical protein